MGKHKSSQTALVETLLSRLIPYLSVLALSDDVANVYAGTRAYLERKGKIIGVNDLWIAAHAVALNLTLVTNNEDEFHRVPNLRIENWTTPE